MNQNQTIDQLTQKVISLLSLLISMSQVQKEIDSIISDLEEQDDEPIDEIDSFFVELKTQDQFNSYADYIHYLTEMKDQLTDQIKGKSK